MTGRRAKDAGRAPLAVILFTVFVDLIGFGIVVPLLAFYAGAFGGSPVVLGLLVASFFLMQFLFAPVLGKLSDRFGRRPVILVSLGLAVIAYMTLAFAASILVLFAARILSGIASANLAVAQAYIADRLPPEERAKGMGLIGAAFGVGLTAGPVISGTLVPYGLAAPAIAATGIALANLAMATAFLPESLNGTRRRVATGRSLRERVLGPEIVGLLATFFVINLTYSAVPVAYPLLGTRILGLSARDLAIVFVYTGLITIVVGGAVGKLAKKAGEEKLVAVGTGLMALAFVATPFMITVLGFYALAGILAVGLSLALPLVPALVSKRIPADEQGAMLGAAQATGSLARIPGPVLAGWTFGALGPSAPFLIAGSLMLLGLGLSARIYARRASFGPEVAAEASG